ncbi:MAG: hypothetical protein M0P01_04605 [Treponema sp.]|nr:hypothetical protein [Treponema sp.]
MTYSVLGQMLIVFLLVINSGRIFFLKYERVDTLAVLAPFAVIVALLQIIAWNADLFSVLLLAVSFLAFFTNIHGLARSASRLYVDHYSPVFIIFSVVILVSSLLTGFLIIRYAPVIIKASDFGVTESRKRLTGSFRDGFSEAVYTDKTNAQFYVYTPSKKKVDDLVVIVGSDKRGDAAAYRPYMIMLAGEGYTVITCDFCANDGRWFNSIADQHLIRRFAMLISYMNNSEQFLKQKDFYTFGMIREYKAMMNITGTEFGSGKKFFIVSDGMADTAADDVMKQSGGSVQGVFTLDSIPEYRTAGFGFVEQTDPLVSACFGLPRDKTLFIPRYLVVKTIDAIKGKNK